MKESEGKEKEITISYQDIHPDFTPELQKEWEEKGFNTNYPKEQRKSIKKLDISKDESTPEEEKLIGSLKLEGFDELEEFYSGLQPDEAAFAKLMKVEDYINQKYPTSKDKFNCQTLDIHGYHWQHNPQGMKEKLTGSLSLRGFVNLKQLNCPFNQISKIDLECLEINDTDVDSGLEYLSDNVQTICCHFGFRPESKVRKIAEQLGASDLFFFDGESYNKKSGNIYPEAVANIGDITKIGHVRNPFPDELVNEPTAIQ
ncbi:2975_t:CDS:2 [Ambispora gerdemannii]|uniref:2975_t:CDS:1 n=1 Tax=Ambispora gerdemannii TaxID=144530 RepID=A0A9N9AJF3_9GLOM|nr:2975_t:CDS:2 [Ambispora gerdemannii]